MRTVLAPALRAEWIKATSLRSIWLCLAIFVVGVAGIGIAVVASILLPILQMNTFVKG